MTATTHVALFGAHKDVPRMLLDNAKDSDAVLEEAKAEARRDIGSPEGSLVVLNERAMLFRTWKGWDGELEPVPDGDSRYTGIRVKVLVDFLMEGPAPAGAQIAPKS